MSRYSIKPDPAKPANSFRNVVTGEVNRCIRTLRAQGTTAMGADNLWACVAGCLPHAVTAARCPDAPKGTNCAYYARQTFNEIISGCPFIL
jgi:hypothetical protein